MYSYMTPVLLGSSREFFPSLDQEDTGITDVPTAHLTQPAGTGRIGNKCNKYPVELNDMQKNLDLDIVTLIIFSLNVQP